MIQYTKQLGKPPKVRTSLIRLIKPEYTNDPPAGPECMANTGYECQGHGPRTSRAFGDNLFDESPVIRRLSIAQRWLFDDGAYDVDSFSASR